MTTYINQPTMAPTRKVAWATMAALASSIAADVAVANLPVFGAVDASELEMLIEALLVTGATFAAGWWVKERA
jgi:hypothetical protein